jgi:hypothetical protein
MKESTHRLVCKVWYLSILNGVDRKAAGEDKIYVDSLITAAILSLKDMYGDF